MFFWDFGRRAVFTDFVWYSGCGENALLLQERKRLSCKNKGINPGFIVLLGDVVFYSIIRFVKARISLPSLEKERVLIYLCTSTF